MAGVAGEGQGRSRTAYNPAGKRAVAMIIRPSRGDAAFGGQMTQSNEARREGDRRIRAGFENRPANKDAQVGLEKARAMQKAEGQLP